jgi:alpha-ketoglutarate-dependent taurine dioxygenase
MDLGPPFATLHPEGRVLVGDGAFPAAFAATRPDWPRENVLAWTTEHAGTLMKLLTESGVVLLRGLPLSDAEHFDAFVRALGLPAFPYEKSLSNAHRISLTKRVFTANEAPSDLPIFLHHEMAQTPAPPSHLFFFCEQAAASGGATPVCRSDLLWERLYERAGDFARRCDAKGLRYTNVMAADSDAGSSMGRSWRSTFRAATRLEAEERLRGLGYSWEWLEGDTLSATTPALPAVRTLPDGRRTFFNQLIAATQGWNDARNDSSRAITFGDGTPLDAVGIEAANQLADELTFDLVWEPGDVALIDNSLAMHGRRSYTGTRRVLAALASAAA